MNSTIQTVRGCGTRDSGKAYLCCGTGPEGLEIEQFIIDPVVPWDLKGHTRGYALMEKNGVNHVVIFVGKGFYPSAWDFVEEARLYGVSRKIAANFPFDKLTPGRSKMYFAHARAIPTFQYSLLQHSQFCIGDCLVKGFHKKEPKTPYSLPTLVSCTFGLRSLSVFHNQSDYVQSAIYRIQKQSYSYNVIPPFMAMIKDIRYQINQGVDLGNMYHIYSQTELHKAPVTYAKEYGIFMWAPITHVEAKNHLPQPVKEKVHLAGYHAEILDY